MCNSPHYKNGVKVTFEMELLISECSARALDALVGYGDDAFIKHFKENLGTAYIRDHEKGLKEFFGQVRSQVLPQIHRVNELRKQIDAPKIIPS